MATQSPASFAVGDSTGYREDLSSLAPRMIDPADAPVYKGVKKTKASQVLHEWLTDALPTLSALPSTAGTNSLYLLNFNAEPSTSDVYSTTLGRARASNRIQQFITGWSISEVSELVAKAGGIAGGIASEVTREIERQMKHLSKAIELTICSAQAVDTDDGSSTPAKLGGFFSKVTTNITTLDTGVATHQGISEETFCDKIEDMFTTGTQAPIWAVATPAMCRVIGTTWTGRQNTRETIQRGAHKIDSVIESYVAPVGGVVNLEPSRTLSSSDALLLVDKSQIAVAELAPVRVYERDPNSFQNRQGRISTYLTLEYGNQKAHGGWKTSSTLS